MNSKRSLRVYKSDLLIKKTFGLFQMKFVILKKFIGILTVISHFNIFMKIVIYTVLVFSFFSRVEGTRVLVNLKRKF